MVRRRSLGWPITLGVVMIILLIALTVGWIFLAAAIRVNTGTFWTIITLGTTFLVLVLVGVVLYLLLSIKEINLNRRQANFIDSVTHELKSPIASLKLYLQTMRRHPLGEQERVEFTKFMLEDVERLDVLITHLLEAARLDQQTVEEEAIDVDLAQLLQGCAEATCQRYRMPEETIRLRLQSVIVRAGHLDLEIIFRNLVDNALKYSGENPQVEIDCSIDGEGMATVRIADNGPGIPTNFRRKIFWRFYRIGSELERSQSGTGLGLYIVQTLVRRLRGKVVVTGRGSMPGTVFEVKLPISDSHSPQKAEQADEIVEIDRSQ